MTSPGDMHNWLSTLKQIVRRGGPACCHFAITSDCNAGCEFCNFSTRNREHIERVHTPVELACAALDVLAANDVRYLIFTGGEPTTEPGLSAMLSRAKHLGIMTILSTNGWLLTADRIREYVDAGVANVVISVDASNAEAHEANRKLPGICSRIAEANLLLRELKVQTAASVTISRLMADLTELPGFLKSLNFDCVTFSYPQSSQKSTYRAFSDSSLLSYTPDELWRAFQSVKELKNEIRVLNPSASIEEMQRFALGKEQRFPCLGGYRHFYLDWNLDVYRCFAWPKPMSSIWEFGPDKLIRDGCVACMSDCFRDGSVMHHIGVALHDAAQSLSCGHVGMAIRQICNRSVLQSAQSLVEQRSRIRLMHRRC